MGLLSTQVQSANKLGMRSSRMSKFEVDDKGKAKEMPRSLYIVYDVSDEA